MGYCIHVPESEFYVERADKKLAAEAALTRLNGNFSWMDRNWKDNKRLEDILDAWRYPVQLDEDDNIIGIEFHGEKIGDEIELFQAIAPWVRKDSFLRVVGEDGEQWRWHFDGQACIEQRAQVTWV